MAPSTFAQHVAAMRFFFAHVVHREFPILHEARPRRRRVLPDVLSVSEVHTVLHALRLPQLFTLCATLYGCGLRRSEGLALEVDCIDRGRGLLHIRDGKGGADRFVPIPPRLQEIPDAHLQREGIGSGPLFLSRTIPGRAVCADNVGKALHAVALELGIAKTVTPHGLRHACRVPGVALRSDGSFTVVDTRFLVPVGAVRKVFPAILTRRCRAALPGFDPPGRVWRTPWNVLIRPCDEGPHVVLNYLTRYVRCGPLHEAQIPKTDDDEVAFRYLDHRTGKVEVLSCAPAGFVARYLQHALPHRFHRVRHYGFLAPGRRCDLRALQIALIARYGPSALAPEASRLPPVTLLQPCPYCGSTRPRHCGTIPPRRPAIFYAANSRAPPPDAP